MFLKRSVDAVGIDVDVFVNQTTNTRILTRCESPASVKEKAVVGSPIHTVMKIAEVRLPTQADFGHTDVRAERGARIGRLISTTYTTQVGNFVV